MALTASLVFDGGLSGWCGFRVRYVEVEEPHGCSSCRQTQRNRGHGDSPLRPGIGIEAAGLGLGGNNTQHTTPILQ